MKLVVILVNYKTADMTFKAALSAVEALHQINGEWRINIIDNDSCDGSYERLNELLSQQREQSEVWLQVKVLASGRNGGFGAGNNFAMRRFFFEPMGLVSPDQSLDTPDYFFLLNSDAFPDANAIKMLVDYMDENPKVGISGSYIYGTDGYPHVTAFRFPTLLGEFESGIRLGLVTKLLKHAVIPIGLPAQTTPVDWLAGASMMIRREVLEQVGLFDETFFLYYEETDLCRRAKKAGWPTHYLPASKVAHIGSASTGISESSDDAPEGKSDSVRLPAYWFESRAYYYHKHYGKWYLVFATAARFFGSCLFSVRSRLLPTQVAGDPPYYKADLLKYTWRYLRRA